MPPATRGRLHHVQGAAGQERCRGILHSHQAAAHKAMVLVLHEEPVGPDAEHQASPMTATSSPGIPAARRPTMPASLRMLSPGKAKPTSSPNSCGDTQRGTASASSRGIAVFPPPKRGGRFSRRPRTAQQRTNHLPPPASTSDSGWFAPVTFALFLYSRPSRQNASSSTFPAQLPVFEQRGQRIALTPGSGNRRLRNTPRLLAKSACCMVVMFASWSTSVRKGCITKIV
jgi:hypothetical protein